MYLSILVATTSTLQYKTLLCYAGRGGSICNGYFALLALSGNGGRGDMEIGIILSKLYSIAFLYKYLFLLYMYYYYHHHHHHHLPFTQLLVILLYNSCAETAAALPPPPCSLPLLLDGGCSLFCIRNSARFRCMNSVSKEFSLFRFRSEYHQPPAKIEREEGNEE